MSKISDFDCQSIESYEVFRNQNKVQPYQAERKAGLGCFVHGCPTRTRIPKPKASQDPARLTASDP